MEDPNDTIKSMQKLMFEHWYVVLFHSNIAPLSTAFFQIAELLGLPVSMISITGIGKGDPEHKELEKAIDLVCCKVGSDWCPHLFGFPAFRPFKRGEIPGIAVVWWIASVLDEHWDRVVSAKCRMVFFPISFIYIWHGCVLLNPFGHIWKIGHLLHLGTCCPQPREDGPTGWRNAFEPRAAAAGRDFQWV